MIVFEGTPGAGKTTMIGSILAQAPDRVIVMPEAQPAPQYADDAVITEALLQEDLDRLDAAHHLTDHEPMLSLVSDRCYIGVLAYRYAMWKSGRMPRENYDRARTRCLDLGLHEKHRDSTVIIVVTPPMISILRRGQYATSRRYAEWFDTGFLESYNRFLRHRQEIFPKRTFVINDTNMSWPTAAPSTANCPVCQSAPRSSRLSGSGISVQLHARGLHIRRSTWQSDVCAQTARDVMKSYHKDVNWTRQPHQAADPTMKRK
jgi:thymidylate kinase